MSDSVPVSGIDTELDFGGSGMGGATLTDDIGVGTFTLNEIQLNSTASGVQTIAGASAANTLTFATNSASAGPQILQNNTGAFVISNGLVLANTLTVAGNGSGTITLSGAISGTGGLTKAGPGTLLLTAANSYTGPTVIAGGTLQLDATAGSLSSATNLTFTGGGTFLYDIGNATGQRSQSFGTTTINFKGGDATVDVNDRTGQQHIFLVADLIGPRSVGATGNFVVNGTADPKVAAIEFLDQHQGLIDQGTFFDGSNYAWMASNGYVRGIDYVGDALLYGTLTSHGAASLSGTDVQATGNITAQLTAIFTTLNLSSNVTFTLAGGATLTVNGILKSDNAGGAMITGPLGSAIEAAKGAELVIRTDQANDPLTINVPVLANGTNALTKSGIGTLVFGDANVAGAANQYSGVTTLNAGNVTFANAAGSAGGGTLVVGGTAGNATLTFASSGTATFSLPDVGGVTGSASSLAGAGAINQSSGTFNYSTGAGGYLQLGTGVQSPGNPGGYGAYALSGGTLSPNGAAAGIRVGSVGLGSFTQSGGTLLLARDWSIGTWGTGVATLTGGTASGAAAYGIAIGDQTGTGTLNLGTLAGGNATLVSSSSAGIQLAGGTGSAGVLNLNAGTLSITGGGIHRGSGASATVNWNGAVLQAAATDVTLLDNTLDGVNVFNGGAVVNTGAFTVTIAAPLHGASGNGLYPAGGTLAIGSGGSGYIGAPLVTVAGGTGAGIGAVSNVSNGVVTGVTITSPGQNYTAGDVLTFAFAGGGFSAPAPAFSYVLKATDLSLNSAGGLKKLGTGTLVVSSTNSYLGATNVLAGTLQVDGSLGNTAVDVAAGATLAGKGTVNNIAPNAVAIDGTVAPGSPGTIATLTTGPMTWDPGGSYTWKVSQLPGGSNGVPGAGWDVISFTSLDILAGGTPGTQFTITPVGSVPVADGQTYTWPIAQLTPGSGGAISGFDPAKFVVNTSQLQGANPYPASDWRVTADGSTLDLQFTAAPEPTSLALLGAAACALCGLRRRRTATARVT